MVGVIDGTNGVIDTGTIMMKAARIQGIETGSTEMYNNMLRAFQLHEIHPIIDKTFAFDDTLEAFAYLKKAQHMGKISIIL
jgi:D-arabinose 1-dehydrogenase-like Zn-dependent alcohol dehydrogenase